MYVAMTRAKTELTVFYVKKRGGRNVLPSRFVHEMQAKVGVPDS